MDIRMYDCGFGDSFLLSDYWDQRNLLVDFGIHSGSSAVNRTAQYDTICTDIMAHENVDFLLTHYHEDHYEGAIVASAKGIRFENVYIPDIWNIDGSVDIVSLILFRGLLTKTVISRNLTLFDFLKAICTCSGKVHFIQRGSDIGSECTALWPSIKYLERRGQKVFDELDPEDSNIIVRLREISSRLVEIVQSLSGEIYVLEHSYDYIQQLEDIKIEYMNIDVEEDYNKQYKLTKFGNEISIVFQNSVCGNNILFTGDFGGKGAWKYIETNRDNLIDMYDKYSIIKLPHHGTYPYYHDFKNRIDYRSSYLLPHGPANNWLIDCRYLGDADIKGVRIISSEDDKCKPCNSPLSVHLGNIEIISQVSFFKDI